MIRIRGRLVHGLLSDIYSWNGMPITIGMSGEMDYSPPKEISGSIPISFNLRTEFVYSDEQGLLRFQVPRIKINFDGIVDEHGFLHVQLPILEIYLTGDSSVEGLLNFSLPAPFVKFTGQQEIQGILNVSTPGIIFRGSGIIDEFGSLTVNIPTIRFSASTERSNDGILSITIPTYRITMSGIVSSEGSLNVSIPIILFHAEQKVEDEDYFSMALNVKNKALTLFENYYFNSLCSFGGKHFGATDIGIFDLDTGQTDDGTIVDWNFKTGYLDLEQKKKKKLEQAWISYKSSGDIRLTVLQPDGQYYEYVLEGITDTENGLRLKFGKGIRSKYVALNISNVNECSVELDELKLHMVEPTFPRKR